MPQLEQTRASQQPIPRPQTKFEKPKSLHRTAFTISKNTSDRGSYAKPLGKVVIEKDPLPFTQSRLVQDWVPLAKTKVRFKLDDETKL